MRVDFYILSSDQPLEGWQFTCKVLEKAYKKQHRVFVFCNNMQDAHLLDELLWNFKEECFIPHHLQGEGPNPPAPIQLGYTNEPKGFNDILINCSDLVPTFHQRFQRIIEIVLNTATAKDISRRHYREYKSLGYQLHVHEI